MDYGKKSLELHKKLKGKIGICPKVTVAKGDMLALAYTPGVAAVSSAIAKNKKLLGTYTGSANSVAVVTDGTAVLGLGDIGPEAALPVMEGKSVIFKEFAGIDAIPLCIKTKNTDEIVRFCQLIEPVFGGINLEDISAPRCFDVLEQLERKLSIPVFHDDQDGTAIVVLAALINACRIANKAMKDLRIVVNGAGAAGISISRLLIGQGVKDLILLDSSGTIYPGRKDLNKYKKDIAAKTNSRKIKGGLESAMKDADVFIGVSKAKLVDAAMVRSMAQGPIIFALANPIPEIMPDQAKKAGASIVGTGRSDFPNQINNALVFPGIFRGLLDNGITKIDTAMKTRIALAIAYSIVPQNNKLLPKVSDKNYIKNIIKAIHQ